MREAIFIPLVVFLLIACADEHRIVLSRHSSGSVYEELILNKPIRDDSIGNKIIYREDGRVQCRGGYMKGRKHGYWTCYRPNGSVAWSASYKEGKEYGEVHCYYEHETWTRLNVSNGSREGPTTEYHYDSTAKKYFFIYGQYVNDQKTGLWIYADTLGNKLCDVWYQQGYPIDTIFYPE